MSPFRVPAEDDATRPRTDGDLHVTVDGEPMTAVPGQTIAAALMASGRDSWRRTRFGDRPRGVFCGIGSCFDCLVTVNDVPDTRACQRTIAAGDAITTTPWHSSVRIRPSDPAPGIRQPTGRGGFGPMNATSGQVVVVGAGPAGIAAALAAADAGAPVLLVDAGSAVGGQYHRQLPDEFRAERPEAIQHDWSSFTRQRERIQQHELITHLVETSVWAIEPIATGHRLHLQTGPADASGRELTVVDTPALVLATGAYDRALPFPGWDLPGVYTAGAAQALAKGQRVAVGKRVLLAGTGPFLLPVAESLLGVGARPVVLLEANSLATVARGWLRDPLVARGKLGEGARYAAMVARHRIPVHHGQTVIAAHGTDRVEAVTVARLDSGWQVVPGSERRIEVDAVCVGFGFTPNLELAVTAGCALDPFVVVDDEQRTSIPGVFAAGEITGIAGAVPSAAEGRVAGAAAAIALGRGHKGPMTADTPRHKGPMNGDTPRARAGDRKAVARGRRFGVALAKAYPVKDGWKTWLSDDTLVCRCEEVTCATVRNADAEGLRAIKLTTRAGLGLCQGRVCARTINALATGLDADDLGASRPIVVPVRLGDLANAPIAPIEPPSEPPTGQPVRNVQVQNNLEDQ